MKLKLYVCLLFCLVPIVINGQGFYKTHDNATFGVEMIDGGEKVNSKFCQVKNQEKNLQFTPYEVEEYGFKNGRFYQSKEIRVSDTVKRVFLERLIKGKITLYYYRSKGIKTFYLERDSILFLEVPRRNIENISYHKQLTDITRDCSNVLYATTCVAYKKKSLTKLISRYNNCELKPFPHLRYGLTFGYELVKLTFTSGGELGFADKFNYKYDGGAVIGLFMDKPIFVSDFSLHTALYYSSHGYSYNKRIFNYDKRGNNQDLDFVANIISFKLPVMVRYSFPANKMRAFLNAGPAFAFNFKNENAIYETIIAAKSILINGIQESSLIEKNQLGYSIGGGIELRPNHKNSVFFELNYSKYYGANNYSMNISDLLFTAGINF